MMLPPTEQRIDRFELADSRGQHPSYWWRAMRKGVKARNGERIRLEHLRHSRKLLTSLEAVERFEQRLHAADLEHFDRDDAGDAASDQRNLSEQHDAATAELNELGI